MISEFLFRTGRSGDRCYRRSFPVSFSLGTAPCCLPLLWVFFLVLWLLLREERMGQRSHVFCTGWCFCTFLPYGCSFTVFPGIEMLYQATGVQVFAVIGWSDFNSKILPAFALAFGSMATVSRLMWTSMLDVLSQDYIKTAKAKGLSQRQIVWKHAVRNAVMPVVTVMGPLVAAVLTGCFRCREYFLYSGTWKILCNQCADSELYYDCRYYSLLRYVSDSRQSGCRFDLRIYRSTY